jgi:acyl-CoA synthetase (AMP-forming)/AMP-acid ligase II
MELIDACHRAAGLQPRPRTPRMQPPGLTAGQLKHTKRALTWTPRQQLTSASTDELPKTISGKIRRVELRERELDRGG